MLRVMAHQTNQIRILCRLAWGSDFCYLQIVDLKNHQEICGKISQQHYKKGICKSILSHLKMIENINIQGKESGILNVLYHLNKP